MSYQKFKHGHNERDERDALKAQLEALKEWKREALVVIPDYQAIGKVLDLPLGTNVWEKLLPEIKELKGKCADWRDTAIKHARTIMVNQEQITTLRAELNAARRENEALRSGRST